MFLCLSLALGMVGFRYFMPREVNSWHDAYLNAAILLGGMGPTHVPTTEGGKIFSGLYALYAGLVFLVVAALLFAPIFHRLLHRFHWDESLRSTSTSRDKAAKKPAA